MVNSHWGVSDLYLKWSILTEVYLTCTWNDQLSLRCIWNVSQNINSLLYLFDIYLKWSNICSWLVPLVINSLWCVLDLYLKGSTLTEVYLTCTLYDIISLRCTWLVPLNAELSRRCTWLVPYMMNSHWGILELYLKWSILTEVYLISNLNYQLSEVYLTCILSVHLTLRCTWLVP
jgi:hypothetical protein